MLSINEKLVVNDDTHVTLTSAGAGATLDKVNAWNRDNRYLKAFHTAAETPTATVQYDVVVLSGEGVAQLADPLTVWLQLLPKFAGQMGYTPPV